MFPFTRVSILSTYCGWTKSCTALNPWEAIVCWAFTGESSEARVSEVVRNGFCPSTVCFLTHATWPMGPSIPAREASKASEACCKGSCAPRSCDSIPGLGAGASHGGGSGQPLKEQSRRSKDAPTRLGRGQPELIFWAMKRRWFCQEGWIGIGQQSVLNRPVVKGLL